MSARTGNTSSSSAACGGGTKETQGQASSETAAASGESAGTEAGETSVGEIKRLNRIAETLLQRCEFLYSLLAQAEGPEIYPYRKLKQWIRIILTNQFHDILPGSSIKEVYEDSAAQYEEIFAADEEMMKTAKKSIREKLFRYRAEKNEEVCAVWNPLSFARTALIRNAEGSWQKITAGPSGVTVCRAVNSREDISYM